MSKLRGGLVTTIRINPTDCQSILDVVEVAGMKVPGMSFAQQVSLTLSSLLATARKEGIIPEPDEFQYLNRLGPYLNGKNNKQKQAMTDALSGAGAKLRVRGLEKPKLPAMEIIGKKAELVIADEIEEAPRTPEQREAANELTELLQKKDMVEAGTPGVIWQATDEDRYNYLVKVVYGD